MTELKIISLSSKFSNNTNIHFICIVIIIHMRDQNHVQLILFNPIIVIRLFQGFKMV